MSPGCSFIDHELMDFPFRFQSINFMSDVSATFLRRNKCLSSYCNYIYIYIKTICYPLNLIAV